MNRDVAMKKFLEKYGKLPIGRRILQTIENYGPFVKALETEMGQHFLSDLHDEMVRLATLIDRGDYSQGDRAEFEVIKSIGNKWAAKINNFYDAKGRIAELNNQ